jgi:flagellin-like hook-associated protein FlgL
MDSAGQEVAEVTINAIDIESMGDVRSAAAANDALASLGNAMSEVSAARDMLSDVQNRLISDLRANYFPAENLQYPGSSMQSDVTAKMMSDSISGKIKQRFSTSTNAQANVMQQRLLHLLGY